MRKGKKTIVIFLITVMLHSFFFQVSATEQVAIIAFTASELNADNTFTLKMTIANATFNAFQFVLRYDTKTLEPINLITKEPAERFNEFATKNYLFDDHLNDLALKLDKNLGLIEFTQYLSPGRELALKAPLVERAVAIGQEPVEMFIFSFRVLSKNKPLIELAKEDPVLPYRDYLPDGGGLAFRTKQAHNIVFDLSALDGISSKEEYVPPVSPKADDETPTPLPEEPSEDVVKRPTTATERLQNTLILQIGNYAAAANGALCHIFPNEKSVVPYIKNDRTYLPIRFVAERLGFEVLWDAKTKSVTFFDQEQTLVLIVGEQRYLKNDVYKEMDVAAEITQDRTMVPIRFVAEALGFAVEWDSVSKMVFITEKELPWLLDEKIEKQAAADAALIISPLLRDFIEGGKVA